MNIIYKPEGRAAEYDPLACNPYNGCTHGCTYCCGPSSLHVTREKYFSSAHPKKETTKRIANDAAYLKKLFGDTCPEILLSFIGDVYQPEELTLGITNEAIKVLIDYDLPFTILTKGGLRAERDFPLLESYPKARFGTTLVFSRNKDALLYEPGAATIKERIAAIMDAHSAGIKTWVSLEPVIDPVQALEVVDELHDYVGHWKVGKINHNRELEGRINWIKYREDIKAKFKRYGITDYYLKKSLTQL